MRFNFPKSWRITRSLLLLALTGQLAACFVVLPDDDDDPVLTDYATFVTVDAGCDIDDWWILTASLSHPAGDVAVQAVWVEVQLVYYDEFDNQFFDDYLGSISLALVGGGDWRIDLSPVETFLDCSYDGEYLFSFFAEDAEGDLSNADLIN